MLPISKNDNKNLIRPLLPSGSQGLPTVPTQDSLKTNNTDLSGRIGNDHDAVTEPESDTVKPQTTDHSDLSGRTGNDHDAVTEPESDTEEPQTNEESDLYGLYGDYDDLTEAESDTEVPQTKTLGMESCIYHQQTISCSLLPNP